MSLAMQNKQVIFSDLGLIDYKTCWDYQENLFNKTVQQKIQNRKAEEQNQPTCTTKNYLLFVEHTHVYTLGKSGNEENLLASSHLLEQQQAKYYKTNRGGDITYHGPGQLVGYPILDLDHFFTDIHRYLRLLEETIIVTLKEYGITSGRSKGETGVWIDEEDPLNARKICAMGVRCSRWVTMHGWGFNVNSDMSYFNNIIPCGIQNKAVTSMQKELGEKINMQEIKEKLKKNFSTLFECNLLTEDEI
jgi:lipoyl(octanoyl) transferase